MESTRAMSIIQQLHVHIAELEEKIVSQKEEILELENLIKLLRADMPDNKEFDE